MHTKAHSLQEQDLLRLRPALVAIQLKRHPEPAYTVVYRISLLNHSKLSVKILGRKWRITDTHGDTKIIEGSQIFNSEPVLQPGAVFSISGGLENPRLPRLAELRLFGKDQLGRPFITPPLELMRYTTDERPY
ncbi:MAG: ApaG domain [Akkermansia sp.]|nr:ApaG domain [Akkermansia sp.]